MSVRPFAALFLVLFLLGSALHHPTQADPSQADQPSQLTLTILHDNDLHGHLFPFAYIEAGKSKIEQPSRGGAARRATLIRRLRGEIKNPTMLIDSGDIATRGPLATTYEGIADVEAMNAVGYELAALGNNEFKLKDGVDESDAAGAQADLLQVVKRSRFPWVCANATDGNGALLEGVQPYIVRQFAGVRVGFLGLTTPRSGKYPQTKGWTISDPVAAAQHWIPEARRHCDVLIALTHLGTDDDKVLAAKTTGLDAIVGGDSHTFLYKAVEVKNPDGVTVPIVQDGEFGADLGRFDLHLTRDSQAQWHLASYQYALLPVGPDLPEASDVREVLNPYLRPFLTVVGHLSEIAPTPEGRVRQTTQVLLDAMRKQTRSDLALNRSGDGFFDVLRHTDVTRYDVYAAMPFHDNVVTADLSGAEVTGLLKAHPDTMASGTTTGLDAAKIYRVAFVDYETRSVYKLPEAELHETGADERAVVIAYFAGLPPGAGLTDLVGTALPTPPVSPTVVLAASPAHTGPDPAALPR